jgi:hypothetical protein
MSYICKLCNYSTDDSGNFSRHKKSKKHINLLVVKSDKKTKSILKFNMYSMDSIPKTCTLSTELTELKNSDFFCKNCDFKTKHKSSYYRHLKICQEKESINELKLKLKLEMAEKEKELYQKSFEEKSEMLNTYMGNFNDRLCEILEENKNLLNGDIIYIEDDTKNILSTKQINNDNNEEKQVIKSQTLILNNVIIISRSEDNYINATQLCKAGDKKFNHWITLESTKELITELESDTGIPASELVEINKGGNYKNQSTWIHPDLAIQLAQWISAKFALQVSKWIRKLFSNSKVEITIKALKCKEKELKIKNEKIKLLENLHIKKQKRENYPDKYVIYILTTEENKKNGIHIIGKAKDLKTRLSTYNKTTEHEVVYYKGCKNEENMHVIENMVLTKLKEFREKANRDRFILPKNKDIFLFTNIIDQSIKFFN